MAAGKYSFFCEQGATFDPVLTWKDKNGALVDLTGYTARMQVRVTIGSEDVIISLTTENDRITLGGAAGTIALLLSATETAALPLLEVGKASSYKYDLEMVSSTGVVRRLLKGTFKVDPEVTR